MKAGLRALVIACIAFAPDARAQDRPDALAPCDISVVDGVDSTWLRIDARDFSFCVPPTYRQLQSDRNGRSGLLRSGEVWIAWGTGRPDDFAPEVEAPVQSAQADVGTDSTGPRPMPDSSSGATACPQRRQTPFVIGSVSLMLTQVACDGRSALTAWSLRPAVWVQGTARSAGDARDFLRLAQTIRFVPRR